MQEGPCSPRGLIEDYFPTGKKKVMLPFHAKQVPHYDTWRLTRKCIALLSYLQPLSSEFGVHFDFFSLSTLQVKKWSGQSDLWLRILWCFGSQDQRLAWWGWWGGGVGEVYDVTWQAEHWPGGQARSSGWWAVSKEQVPQSPCVALGVRLGKVPFPRLEVLVRKAG